MAERDGVARALNDVLAERGRLPGFGHAVYKSGDARFDALLTERRVRPTALAPVWRLAGFALGAGTALLGDKAAHACTEAVETVIEEHYAGQIAELQSRDPDLAAELSRFRDEELAHRDLAVEEGAREAPGYSLLAAVIRTGCRAAIKLSEKV